MRATALLAAFALPLAGCNQNTAVGNDREAQVEAPPTPAAVMNASAALQNVATAIIKPETMTGADIEVLGGRTGRCVVKLTEVAFPSFLYEPGGAGAIKLNGKLIPLPSAGQNRFADGGLSVLLNPLDEEGDAGLQGIQMVIIPPGAEEEIGYNGFVQCFERSET